MEVVRPPAKVVTPCTAYTNTCAFHREPSSRVIHSTVTRLLKPKNHSMKSTTVETWDMFSCPSHCTNMKQEVAGVPNRFIPVIITQRRNSILVRWLWVKVQNMKLRVRQS